jgi:hypothetical protein
VAGAPAYRASVRRGISAITLDQDGKITRLTTVWDGAMIPDADIKALIVLTENVVCDDTGPFCRSYG